jgi:hypothetical protein
MRLHHQNLAHATNTIPNSAPQKTPFLRPGRPFVAVLAMPLWKSDSRRQRLLLLGRNEELNSAFDIKAAKFKILY